jgi:hypothetical protein
MSDKKWIDVIVEHAKSELKIMNLDKVKFGDTIITFIKELHEISGNHPQVMKSVVQSIADLIDEKPITPITASDFTLETHSEGGRTFEVWRCTRYPHVYKAADGKYYDDRAIVYKTCNDSLDKQYIYQGELSSKREVLLPYVVREEIVILNATTNCR